MLSIVEIGRLVLERKIFKLVNVFSLFRNYLPLEKGGAIHLKKNDYPSVKDDFCQVWLKLAQWFWSRRFINFVNVFFLFRNYLPLEKGTCVPFTKGCFVLSLVEIGPIVLEKKIFKFRQCKLLTPSLKDALCQVWMKLTQRFWRRR